MDFKRVIERVGWVSEIMTNWFLKITRRDGQYNPEGTIKRWILEPVISRIRFPALAWFSIECQ